MRYRIRNSDTGHEEVLYWSNADGWVTYESSDSFRSEERRYLTLPVGGEWIPEDFRHV